MPTRIHWHRFLGVPLPRQTRRVTRGSRWGNPFTVETFGRDLAVWLFTVYARQRLAVEPDWLAPLRGYDLACTCRPHEACHADILLRLAHGNSPCH